MNLSMKWLSDFIEIDISPREFAEAMTMSGSKVEGYTIEGNELDRVVVGKILSVEKHPNADSLVICMLEVGEAAPVQIVTGAKNVFPGAMVPVALAGSTLPGGVKIKKGKLRGVESCGMLCSVAELGVTVHDFPYAIEDGIFILEEECAPGQDIREAIGLNDTCVEFEITSNRPDCLSVLGLAREAAATFSKPFQEPQPVVKGAGGDIRDALSVEVQTPALCPRYVARMVKNVKIEPSPRWMRERLRASGVRPINNLVDITNYVMLEYGQPMHAFDFKYVEGGKIVVRCAQPGEKIMTLDGIERTLSPEMLVIADEKKPSAVAGVMGGEFSGIMDDTRTVVFESACFAGASVRKTAKKLGMRTESSARFEKGLDPMGTIPAVQRACELVELLGAGEVVDGMIDVDNSSKEPVRVRFEPEWTNRFLGLSLGEDEMRRILASLSFRFEGEDVIAPSFRSDIEHKADIAEEIARIYGYNNIPTTLFKGHAEGKYTEKQKFVRAANTALLAQGISEIMTYSFISPKYYDKIGLAADSALRDSVTICNPLGEDTSVMRTTTIPSMLEVLARNYNNRNASVRLYEIGTQYRPQGDKLPVENDTITVGMYGGCDFFTLKGVVEVLLDALNVPGWEIHAESGNPTFHPGRCGVLTADGETLGVIGQIHPRIAGNYEIDTPVYLANLLVNALFAHRGAEKSYRPLPKYPATNRDIAVLCDEELPVGEMEKAISAACGKILERVELFDIYRGEQIPQGKKSVAFNIVMRSAEATLTDEEIEAAVKRVLKALEKLGAALRM